EGVLQTLKIRLADATRALSRAPESDRPRVMKEIADLERQIELQERIVENPHATAPVSAADWRGGAPPEQARTWEPAVLERTKPRRAPAPSRSCTRFSPPRSDRPRTARSSSLPGRADLAGSLRFEQLDGLRQ